VLTVAICGDGPIAHSLAAACGARGLPPRLLVADPTQWGHRLASTWPDGSRRSTPIASVTDDPAAVLAGAELVFLCVPHAAIDATLHRIAPHLDPGALVGAVPGFGGFGPLARRRIGHVDCLFGTQRIPFVVRACRPGRSVHIGGIRRQTFVGTMPAARARPLAELLAATLGVRTVPVPHYFSIELSPSNSIVNPARLYALFGPEADESPGPGTGFFSDWNAAASHVLLKLDRELQDARRRVPRDTAFVAPMLPQYDACDAGMLTDRIRSLHALAGRSVPLRNGRLDLRSAYVREDIDIGLRLIRDILHLAGADTPTMDAILAWRAGLATATRRSRTAKAPGPLSQFADIEALARALD
jgi:opine dehydrogenase